MTTVLNLIKLIAACIPVAALLFLLNKCNLKRVNRGRQFLMPVIAAVYCLVVFLAACWLNHKVKITIQNVDIGFVNFWTNTGLEERAQMLLERLNLASDGSLSLGGLTLPAELVQSIVNFVLKYLLFLINLAVVLVFLVVKGISLPILSGIWSKHSVMDSTSAAFYEYDEENRFWFLQERMRDMKKLMRAFYLAAACITVALMVASQQFYDWAPMQAVLFPCFGALILGECAFLLGGYTKSEYEEDILGEDAKTQRVVNLAKLRESLKRLFGERLLLEGTELESAGRSGVTDLLETMAASDDTQERIAAEYFQILQAEGVPLDVDNVVSAVNLLKGESVLFCNPFYRDLNQYFLLPMTNTLMSRRKVLVIAGRKSTEPEIQGWLEEAIQDHLKMSGLWRVGPIGNQEEEYEIGILSFSQLYNLDMLSRRREFFHEVGLVLILEPSLILATGQVGLSLVVNYCDEDGTQPNYCMCDRNCDGLVDTLSHMIKQSITIVSATETPTCLHSEMCWHSDGAYLHQRILPDISRYLGVGTELAVASVKEQVPRVVWRSENKFPVVDMKWFAGQYYGPICQYANLPSNQEAVYQAIGFEADLWGTPKEAVSCLIVEDEFCNLLEMVRLFLTRAEEQAFVNVISEDYLLRGYMQHNYRIFSADQKAIPSIVPDYARTERNATFRLMMLLLMSESVPAELVEKELRLVGIQSDDLCDTLNDLIRKYTQETRPVVLPVLRDAITGFELESGAESHLHIREADKPLFLEHVGPSFQTAYFITEDDKEGSSFMDAKLYGHIYQFVLPGQFFTYDGKYYEVRSVTSEKGVLVRRAADHIVGRRYYRQKRSYHLEAVYNDASRTRMVNGLEVTTCQCDLNVETTGYLELDASNDLRRAREVRLADPEQQGAGERLDYTRTYRAKNVLKIRIPGADESVRYTLCVLLMEVFRTVYADSWHYLAAVTPQTEATLDALRGMLYTVDSLFRQEESEADYIYIIEDSDVDMGLLESVDRNLNRLLGIVADYLDWHVEMMNTPDPPEPQPVEVELPPEEKHGILWHIKNFFRKIGNFFKRLFHIKTDPEKQKSKEERKAEKARKKAERKAEKERKKAERAAKRGKKGQPGPTEEQVPTEAPPEPELPPQETEPPAPVEPAAEPPAGAEPEEPDGISGYVGKYGGEEEPPAEGGNDGDEEDDLNHFSVFAPAGQEAQAPDEDIDGEDSTSTRVGGGNRYQRSCYLRFGYEGIDGRLAVAETLALLNELGFGDNELYRARTGHAKPDPASLQDTEQVCDFCGLPLNGVAFDVLNDGRVRCVSCSASAINSVEEFRALYQRTLPSMEGLFNIRIGVPIRVRTADARAIAKHRGIVFKPSSHFDARVVGFAQHDRNGYSLYIENGAPRLRAMSTIVHELTHIWQYVNWDDKAMRKKYGKGQNRDIVYEGMAMWAEIQFLYLIGENHHARRQEENTLRRQDVYGEGFRLFCQKYPLSRSACLPAQSPFHTDPPL